MALNAPFDIQAELFSDTRSVLGEGPLWHDNCLYWIDIMGRKLHRHDASAHSRRVYELDRMPGMIVPRKSGGFVMAMEDGFYFFDPEHGRYQHINDPEPELPTRFNDGKCDPQGRLWAGTMGLNCEKGIGSLYRLDCNLALEKVLENVTISNGIAWSADGATMYYIDTMTRRIDAFDYEPHSGALKNRRPVFEFEPRFGWPDGMTIDQRGNLWVALAMGWSVVCINPATAAILATVRLPAALVTSCCFGGPMLDRLYITTGTLDISSSDLEKQPWAGSVFVADVGSRGLPCDVFHG